MNITAKSNGREQASAYMLKLDIDTYKCTAVRGLGESEWWTHVWVADWCFYMQICNRICMLTWLFVVFLHLYQCAVVRSDGKWTSQAYTASCPLLMRCRCVRIILFGSVMILVCYRRLLRTILYLCRLFGSEFVFLIDIMRSHILHTNDSDVVSFKSMSIQRACTELEVMKCSSYSGSIQCRMEEDEEVRNMNIKNRFSW